MTRNMILANKHRRKHVNNNNINTAVTAGKQDAVLVTGPRISREETSGSTALLVEAESYRDVDISESSAFATGSVTTITSNTTSSISFSNNPIRRLLETSFLGGPSKPPAEQELEDLAGAPLSHSHPRLPPRQRQQQQQANGDDHSDHDNDYDDDDVYGEDLQKHYFNDHRSRGCASSSETKTINATSSNNHNKNTHRTRPCSYLLGETYYSDDDARRRADEASLFWFTYRCDFPCIVPYNITSDAGWGCMLRALQMLTAQSLRLHFKGRQWRPPQNATTSTTQSSIQAARQDPFVRSILTWFADFPSTTENLYSLHNMVAAGVAKYDKLPGEWYEPGTACYVLRDLVEMHIQHHHHQQQQQYSHGHQPKLFRVHVASGATVYRDEIDKLVASEALEARSRMQQETNELAHPLDLASWEEQEEDGVVDGTIAAGGVATVISKRSLVHPHQHLPWDTALLLLIPLRLGLKSFRTEYCPILAHTFSLPQSVGILGGRPRGARWFYGAHADGRQILGLDPHTVQMAPRRRRRLAGSSHQQQQPSFVVELSDDYIQSVHTAHPEVFALPKLDPSIALGFYCRTRADFEHVVSALQKFRQDHPGTPELFAVADCAPDYEASCFCASTSSGDGDGGVGPPLSGTQNVLLKKAMIDDDDSEDNDKTTNDEDDDDEFVLL